MMDSRWKRPSPKYLPREEGELWHTANSGTHLCACRFPKPRCAEMLGTQGQQAQPGLPVSMQPPGMLGWERKGMLGARRDAHASMGWPGAAPSQWLVLDVAASISNRISSQQLHFKAFHSAALME